VKITTLEDTLGDTPDNTLEDTVEDTPRDTLDDTLEDTAEDALEDALWERPELLWGGYPGCGVIAEGERLLSWEGSPRVVVVPIGN
jgi:hypothetical protein